MQSIMADGKKMSIQPISREKRFKIRPDGLVLKKYMVARVMPRNSWSCSRIEALRQR